MLVFTPKNTKPKMIFGVNTSMTLNRIPKYAAGDKATVDTQNELFVVLGFLKIALQLVWLGWMVKLSWQTRKHLRTLPYMTTRFEQLSYRFLVLETLLVICYVSVFSGLQMFQLFETWYHLGFDSFIQASVHSFAMAQKRETVVGQAYLPLGLCVPHDVCPLAAVGGRQHRIASDHGIPR
jgi:hypothetical protein